MTDDDRLAELFRAAAADPAAPPPGFDHRDVLSASRRITARRRSALVAGAFALFAVVGVGAAVALPDSPTATSAAAPAAADRAEANRVDAAQAPAPEAGAQQAGKEQAGAERAAAGDAADAAGAAPAGPARRPVHRCPAGPRQRGLRRPAGPAAAGLPGAGAARRWSAPRPRPAPTSACPGRSATSPSRCRTGLFGVSYLPPGTVPDLAPGAVSARHRVRRDGDRAHRTGGRGRAAAVPGPARRGRPVPGAAPLTAAPPTRRRAGRMARWARPRASGDGRSW